MDKSLNGSNAVKLSNVALDLSFKGVRKDTVLAFIKTLRDVINDEADTSATAEGWESMVCYRLDEAADYLEFPERRRFSGIPTEETWKEYDKKMKARYHHFRKVFDHEKALEATAHDYAVSVDDVKLVLGKPSK